MIVHALADWQGGWPLGIWIAATTGLAVFGAIGLLSTLRNLRNQNAAVQGARSAAPDLREPEGRVLMQAVLDALPEAVFLTDLQGNYRLLNAAMAARFGRTSDALAGKSEAELAPFDNDSAERVRALDRQAIETGAAAEIAELRRSLASEAARWDHVVKVPVRNEAGTVIGLVGIVQDITGRKQAQEALRQSQRLLQTIVDTLPVYVSVKDRAGRYRLVNRLLAASLPPSSGDLVGRTAADNPAATEARLRWSLAAERRLLETGKTQRIEEIPTLRRPGTESWERVTKLLLRDESGQMNGILTVSEDITKRKRGETALKESEARFRMLFEQATDGIFVADTQGNYVDVNASACQMLGYSRDELLRLNFRDVVAPVEFDQAVGNFHSISCGQTLTQKRTLIRKDASRVRAEIAGKIRPDGLIQAVVRDITGRERAEEALRKSETLLAEAQRFAGLGAWALDLRTGELWWSDGMYRLMGILPGDQPPGLSVVLDKVHPEDRAALQKVRETVLAAGSYEGDYRIVLPDGTMRILHGRAKGSYDKDGVLVSMEGIDQDVTARKRAEAERMRLHEHLQRSRRMESIGTLAGGIAHDFNNLLSPILGFAELLQQELADDAERAALVAPILDGARRGRDLVQRILLFSRRSSAPREPVLLAPIVTEVLALLRATLPPSIAILPAIAGATGPVEADAAQLHEMLMNLCINAAHAMPDGGTLGVRLDPVELDAQPDYLGKRHSGNFVRIEVSDTGTGMTEEVMSHLFEPFFTTKEVGKGTGLGLSGVLGIVQEHGGAVDVSTRLGAGSTFTVYLPPIAESASQAAHPVSALLGGSEAILCVDDEPHIAALLSKMLQPLGYRVSVLTDAAVALEILRAEPQRYDLVVTDLSMPKITGVQLARRIHELRADLPVLVCTGNDEHLPGPADRTPNIVAVLQKPIDWGDLSRAVRRNLDRGA